jgi:hypothetical protein
LLYVIFLFSYFPLGVIHLVFDDDIIILMVGFELELQLEFLIDNTFVSFGGALLQQVVGIRMGTNCAPLLADLFLYS